MEENRVKRMILLACAAMAAMAFAVLAVASANGGALQDTETLATAADGTEIRLTGTSLAFVSEFGGYANCDIHGDLKVENAAANAGTIVNKLLNTGSCVGVGLYGGCEVVEDEFDGTWHFTVTGHDIDLEDGTFIGTNGGALCPEALTHVDVHFEKLTLVPLSGSNTSLNTLTVEDLGNSTADFTDLGIEGAEIALSGKVHTEGSDRDTWQIETVGSEMELETELHWTHGKSPLKGSASDKLSGLFGFSSSVGNFQCTVHAPVTLKAPAGGSVNSFEATAKTCAGTKFLSSCKLTGAEATGLPWSFAGTEAEDVSITGVVVDYELSGCSFKAATVGFEAITGTPDDPEAIEDLTLIGEGDCAIGEVEVECDAYGTLDMAEHPGTYGIENP